MLRAWTRALILWSCRLVGALHGLLQRKLVLHLVLLALIAGGLWLADRLGPAAPKPWLTGWNLASVWALGLIVWWVVQARRRLFIAMFDDYTGKQAGVETQGFGILLAAELASLSDLFNEFEAGRTIQATPEKLAPLSATFQTETAGQFLEKAVSAETAFQLGPFKFPVGVVLSLVGRLVQGPRLTGQIHRDVDQRILTVALVGSRGERSWRIVDPPRAQEGDKVVWRPAADLAHELACRIFGETALDRAVTWRALSHFAAGVGAYRESLRTPKQRKFHLRNAEHRLIEALAEDPHFDLAYYDLGVVYTELEQFDAAGLAFTRAVDENNRRWSAYYALALNSYGRAVSAFNDGRARAAVLHLSKAIDQCDQALQLASEPVVAAQVLNLKASVLWWRGWRMWPDRPEARFREFYNAGRMGRRAARKAWWALCRVELGVGMPAARADAAREQARVLASRYLQDLSMMLVQSAEAARSEATKSRQASLMRWLLLRMAMHSLQQARRLTPETMRIQLDLGSVYLKRRNDAAAVRALQLAARLAPASAEAWGFLALAVARRGDRSQADEAAQRVFDNLHTASDESLESLARAMDVLAELLLEIQAFSAERARRRQAHGRARVTAWAFPRFARYAYRLADCDVRNLTEGTNRLVSLLRDSSALEAPLAGYAKTAERARKASEFRRTVANLLDRGEDGVEPLKALLAEKTTAGHDWEVGEVGHGLARLYLRLGRPADAEASVRASIEHLEKSLYGEIQRRGLYALLSRITRRQGKSLDALNEALRGLARDPVSAYERTELGWVYSELAEYASAQAAWEEALLLTPDDPSLHMNLGIVVLRQVDDARDRATRGKRLDQAAHHFGMALSLFEPTATERNGARLLLARTHVQSGRYTDAVRDLRALEAYGYGGLIVSIELADAYFSTEEWAEAEARFRRVQAQLDQRAATAAQGVNEILETAVGDSMAVGAALAFAHLGIAASLAEREIRLDQALAEIGLARAALENLGDAALKASWTTRCNFHEGSVLAKLGRIDEAIAKLETTLAASTDADTYFALGDALIRKAELSPSDADKRAPARRAIHYCEEARRLDWTGERERKIGKTLARAESLGAR